MFCKTLTTMYRKSYFSVDSLNYIINFQCNLKFTCCLPPFLDTSWKNYDSPHDLVGRSFFYYSRRYYDHPRVSDQDDQSADSAESAEEFFEVENSRESLPDLHDKSTGWWLSAIHLSR